MNIPGVFDFTVSNIGADGIQYYTGMLEPERLDANGMRTGKAFDITLDHLRQRTTISTFMWIGGAPHNWEVATVIKGEVFAESEVKGLLEKYGLIKTAETVRKEITQ